MTETHGKNIEKEPKTAARKSARRGRGSAAGAARGGNGKSPLPAGAIIGEGFSVADGEREGGETLTLVLPDSDREGHVFTMGATRSGKTRLAEAVMEHDIRCGRNLLWIDPKGDARAFSKIAAVARETGREEDLMFFSPLFPELSAKIDPLSHWFMPEEVVGHVVSGVRTREEFYFNVAYEVTLVVVRALSLIAESLGKKPAFTFAKIKENMGYGELGSLRAQVAQLEGEEARETLLCLDQILSSPQDYFSKVSSSLRAALTALSSGSVGRIMGRDPSNRFMERLESGRGAILVAQTGSLLTRRTAHITARVLLSMVQSFVGRVFASNGRVDPPLCVHADEASNVLYFGADDLFGKAGGAGVWLHMLAQSRQDLVAELGPAHAAKILDNANTRIVFRVNDPQTAEYASRMAGRRTRFSPVMSLGGGLSVRETEEDRIPPESFMRLGRREFFAFSFGGAHRGRTLDVEEAPEIRFPRRSAV